MSSSLPERPDLEQLRRQAKELRDAARAGNAAALERFSRYHPSTPQAGVTLAAAQLVVAREQGFPSWPKLKVAVEGAAVANAEVEELVAASIDGRDREAQEIFRSDPDVAARSLIAACVLGDAEAVGEGLATDPAAAVAIDAVRGWPPLLYACYSRWHRIEPSRESGLGDVVRLLLAAGASPRTNDGGRQRYRSALKGSVEVDNPSVAEVLLEAGANPDDGQCIGEAASHRYHRCLELLLSHGARVAGTWALSAAVWADDAVATTMLLDALAGDGGRVAEKATDTLLEAASDANLPVVEALLAAGADPRAADREGVSAFAKAVRAGKAETAERLLLLGATDDSTEIDRFLGACLRADRPAAEQLLRAHPDVFSRLTPDDRVVIVDAAAARPAAAIELLLDVGFSTDQRNDLGEAPLHSAAFTGNAEVVRLLLQRGADVDARDTRFEATPLAFATVGSGEEGVGPGQWVETVELLVEAGADRAGSWVTDKPPSEEVMDLVLRYGLTPEPPDGEDKAAEQSAHDQSDEGGSVGTGVMAEVARHLEAAYREVDFDLLGSLLHPEVRWTGLCKNRADVMEWYRGFFADGVVATVQGVEVDRDAVIIWLDVAHQAEGARPVPPERRYQVLIVQDAQVVDIHGYPDRASALARHR